MRKKQLQEDALPLYPLASVDNALRLLICLGRGRAIRVADAAAELHVAPSTAHRLLAMLEYRGLARQLPQTKAYLAGDAFIAVGQSLTQARRISDVALPELRSLAVKFGEAAAVGTLDGPLLSIVAQAENQRRPSAKAFAAITYPAADRAAGELLLRAPSTKDYAKKDLLLRLGRHADDLNEIAVVIRATRGEQLYGALTIAGPKYRFEVEKMRDLASELKRAARRIATNLEAIEAATKTSRSLAG